MSKHVTAERVIANAAAAGIPMDTATAARVAGGTGSTAARFRAGNTDVALEAEPATYSVVALKEISR
jgi:hypothetical protein